jgi:hypothetical protein
LRRKPPSRRTAQSPEETPVGVFKFKEKLEAMIYDSIMEAEDNKDSKEVSAWV